MHISGMMDRVSEIRFLQPENNARNELNTSGTRHFSSVLAIFDDFPFWEPYFEKSSKMVKKNEEKPYSTSIQSITSQDHFQNPEPDF